MQGLWDFGGRAVIVMIIGLLLSGGIAGYALASWGRMRPWVGIVVGALGQGAGLIVLLAVGAGRRAEATRARKSAQQIAQLESQEAAAPSTGFGFGDTGSGGSGFGDSGFGFAGSTSAPAATGFGSSSVSGFGSSWSDGDLGAQTVAVEPEPDTRRRGVWFATIPGILFLAVGAVGILLLMLSLTIGWVSFDSAVTGRFWFYPVGTGVDVVVYISAALAALAIVVMALRPLRSAAVVLAWVGGFWMFAALLTFSAQYSIAELLFQIGDFSGEIGESLGISGVPGVDQIEGIVSKTDIGIGSGIYLVLTFGVVAQLIAIFAIWAAGREARPIPVE